jgi:uncharacterized membrane protein
MTHDNMEHMNLSIRSSIAYGWETFKKRPWFFIFIFLFISVLSGGFDFSTNDTKVFTPQLIALLVTGGLISFLIQILLSMGKNQLLLRAHHGVESLAFWDLWAPHPFWKFIGGYFLTLVIVLVGFLLLIIPGIVWSLKYMFVPLIIMDKKMRPFEALRESARITDGHKWDLLLFVITLLGINILGLLCLIVGLLVSVPVTSLAFVHAYRSLSGQAHSHTH